MSQHTTYDKRTRGYTFSKQNNAEDSRSSARSADVFSSDLPHILVGAPHLHRLREIAPPTNAAEILPRPVRRDRVPFDPEPQPAREGVETGIADRRKWIDPVVQPHALPDDLDRKSTRLNSSH